MARVVEDDVGLRVERDAIILIAEVLRGSGRDDGLDLTDGDLLNPGVAGEGAGGDARAKADAEHGFRIRVQQGGQVANHALQLHVENLGGGFHVAVDVHVDGAVVPARDGDRGVAAFLRIENGGIAFVDGHAAAIGDEFAGDGIHAPGNAGAEEKDHADECPGAEGFLHHRDDGDETAQDRDDEQQLFGLLRADAGDENEADQQRSDDAAESVCGVNASGGAAGILTGARDGGAGERETRAPEERGGQDGPDAALQIELVHVPGVGGEQDIVLPVRERVDDGPGSPCHAGGEQNLAPAERGLGFDAAQESRTGGAADGESAEEDGQDDRENVDGGQQEHAEQAGPDHFGAERGGSGEGDGEIDGPVAGGRRVGFGVGQAGGGRVRRGGGDHAGHQVADGGDGEVDRHGGVDAGRHVVNAQQPEAGQEAAADGAKRVRSVKEAPPGDTFAGAFNPADDGGK